MTPQLYVISDPSCHTEFSTSILLSLPLDIFPSAQENQLKNTGEHGSSLQHDLRRGLSCQLWDRTTVARGGNKLSKPSGKARGTPEQTAPQTGTYPGLLPVS